MVLKLAEKMNEEFSSFELGFSDYSVCANAMKDEMNKFDDMRTNMFHFGLISAEDFIETCNTASDLWFRKLDAMQNIECAR